ncbi:MAG TPA: SDR family NAD(P)-dependent oxidoreductase [Tepidisphaeraceae bacterium]|nr:SDR family NAD(P)-dependent oxidoreductase [Tepidisphaeraceae bacterium]
MSHHIDLSGKVALVTGSSRGIGAGILRALAECGAKCIVNYVADPDGKNLKDGQSVADGIGGASIMECDIGDDTQVAATMQRVKIEFGGLDILINNAGILRDRSLAKMTHAEWDSVIRVNLTGTFNCLHHATPILRKEGRVVNLSSVSGTLGFFGQANYSASKAGIIALTKTAARELAKQQITVNAIAPGFIDTDMTRGTMPDDVVRKFMEQVPVGRIGRVEDIVNAALFFCSPQSSYVTGQVLHVNGGFFMGS